MTFMNKAIEKNGGQDKLLSICLLTYNQPDDVYRLLNRLSTQLNDDVELIIRDDSTDNKTECIVKNFSKHLKIRYFHGKKEGIDRTVIFLTKVASGKFVWWLGDDDIVGDAVEQVLDVIRYKPEVSFIWANYRLVSCTKLAIDLPNDTFFENRDQLLELGASALGFVSATIFDRKIALLGIDAAEKYVGSKFANLFIVLFVISQPGKLYYKRGEIVICHPTTSDEAKASVVDRNGVIDNWAFQVFGINFSNILRHFSGVFSKSAIRAAIKETFGKTWRGVLVAYVGGWDTPVGKSIPMVKNFWMFPECWLALFLFNLPKVVLIYFYRIYKVFLPKFLIK